MPYIELKTNLSMPNGTKQIIASKITSAFAEASEKAVAENIEMVIIDNCWIQFRGNYDDPAAFIQISPGPLTPEADYARIVTAILPVLRDELKIPSQKIYATVLEFKHWGYDNQYLC